MVSWTMTFQTTTSWMTDDSDLEIYDQVKGLKPVPRVYSIAESDEEERYNEDSQMTRHFDPDADVHMDENGEHNCPPASGARE